jgi:hypothetical protein
MKKIVSALLGLTMALAMTGISFAQDAPAPAAKTTTKKAKKNPKAKKTKKSVSATPSK